MAERSHDPRGAELSVQVVDLDRSTQDPLEPERWAIATHGVNVLIQGTGPFIRNALAVLRRDLPHREFIWPDRPTIENTLSATVLVLEIGELPPYELDALARLVAGTYPRVQVIVTSSIGLHELVERGRFPADLYYRLNIVMLTDEVGALSGQARLSPVT